MNQIFSYVTSQVSMNRRSHGDRCIPFQRAFISSHLMVSSDRDSMAVDRRDFDTEK